MVRVETHEKRTSTANTPTGVIGMHHRGLPHLLAQIPIGRSYSLCSPAHCILSHRALGDRNARKFAQYSRNSPHRNADSVMQCVARPPLATYGSAVKNRPLTEL